MKTHMITVVGLASCLLLAHSGHAQFNVGNLQLGAGLSYVMPSVDGMPNVENAIGYTISAGYPVNEHITVVLDMLMIPKIENDEDAEFTQTQSRYYRYSRLELPLVEASAIGFLASVQYRFLPLQPMPEVIPYLSAGIGFMKFKAEKHAGIPPEAQEVDWNEDEISYGMDTVSGPCIRIGGGAQYFITPNVSLSADLSFLQGISDIDAYSHIAISGFVGYHFN